MSKTFCILFEYEKINPTVQGTIDYFCEICKNSNFHAMFKNSKSITQEDLTSINMLVSIRPSSRISEFLAVSAKRSGIKYLVVFDDDLVGLYENQNFIYRRNSAKKCIGYADLIAVCNPILYEKYKIINPAIRPIITKTIITSMKKYKKKTNLEKIRFIYPTSQDHISEWNMISGAFFSLPNDLKDRIELNFLGIEPGITEKSSGIKIVQHPYMSFEKYKIFMDNERFDIGLAPLCDNEFNNCKYFNKYLDYSQFGIMGIYSDMPLYGLVVRNGDNGLLAKNDVESWRQTLVYAINNECLISECVLNAQEHLKMEFARETLCVGFQQELLTHLKDSVKGNIALSILRLRLIGITFDIYDKARIMLYSCGTDGFCKTISRIKMHISRKIKKYHCF